MPKNSLNIKQVRKDLNLTQQQFADKISVPIGRVNAWEMRGSTPKVQDYNSIIKLLEEKLEIFEQAKEMHKQEIIAAKDDGYNDAEQYYNETFVAQK